MRVINTGKTNLEVSEAGHRFEVELVLQDVAGKTIGARGVVFPYKKGHRQAIKVRNELRKQIPSVAQLFEPASKNYQSQR